MGFLALYKKAGRYGRFLTSTRRGNSRHLCAWLVSSRSMGSF